ncbi:MAG TPA: hemerythrin family protein [Rhodospirillaceae bacterium]|nr:hemerythrin family protein [Rhodospirillaceae bacterium]
MTTFIRWSEDMSVGAPDLDAHHRMIIDCLNALHPLLGAPDPEDRISEVLRRLEEFVLIHFSEEEQAMRKAGYPDWRQHKTQHDAMYDVVYNLKSDIEHGRTVDARHLFDLIYDWLIRHILGEDKKYRPFLEHPEAQADSTWHRGNGRPV